MFWIQYKTNPRAFGVLDYLAQEKLGYLIEARADQLLANDFNGTATGSYVPTTGANLLQLTAQSSPSGFGTWGLFAIQGAANTAWTNAASTPATIPFVNVPLTPVGGMVRIGTFTVTPEPASCTLIALAGLGAFGIVRRRWKRSSVIGDR